MKIPEIPVNEAVACLLKRGVINAGTASEILKNQPEGAEAMMGEVVNGRTYVVLFNNDENAVRLGDIADTDILVPLDCVGPILVRKIKMTGKAGTVTFIPVREPRRW